MKTTTTLKAIIFILACLFVLPSFTLDARKKKREKKPYEWVMPEKLSGIPAMDEYLLYCDTMWTKIQSYKDSITFFQLDTLKRMVNGQPCYVVKIRDQYGNERNFSQSIVQSLEIISNGTLIVLDAVNISLMTTSATLSLTENPLVAFSHGKYLKAGPNIVKLAYNEVREIVNATKKQVQQTRSMRTSKLEGSTDQAYIFAVPEEEVNIEEYIDLEDGELGSNDGELDFPEEEFDNIDWNELEMPEEPK